MSRFDLRQHRMLRDTKGSLPTSRPAPRQKYRCKPIQSRVKRAALERKSPPG